MNPTHTPPDVGDPTPANILRYAALYLQRHGWHQGDMFADPTQPFPAACAQDAIRIAVCGGPTTGYTTDTALRVDRAVGVLADHLDTHYGWWGYDDDGDIAAANQVVGDWNDETDRTAAHVIEALTGAADDWDHTHGGAV